MAKERLDKYLQGRYRHLSRAYIKQQIRLGNFLVYHVRSQPKNSNTPQSKPQAKSQNKLNVKIKLGWTSNGVNGKKVKPSYELRQGDLVALAPGFILPCSTQILPNPDIKLDVIYEDNNVIVINKPAGLAVHPRQDKNGSPSIQEIDNTLISGLLAYYPKIANIRDTFITLNLPQPLLKEGSHSISLEPPPHLMRGRAGEDFSSVNIRPGIVHRLDKDTSGLMIVAKNQKSFDWLKKQFKERKVTKKYIALVCGQPKENQGIIKTYLVRSKSDPSKQKVLLQETAGEKLHEAITKYKIIKSFKNFSLIQASPKTGRLHQIRVHLTHLGHPVAGDTKYGRKNRPALKNLVHQFLHAEQLKITLPDGQKKVFSSPLPKELKQVIAELEKNK